MTPEATTAKLNQIFEAIVLRCGSMRMMGKRCGRSLMWIWRQLRKNKSFDLRKVAKVLADLEVPQRFFFEQAADASPALDPAWVLDHFRRSNGQEDPFLAAIQQRIRPLLELRAVHGLIPRRHREIETLEERCLTDADRLKAELELLAGGLVATAEASAVATNSRVVARGPLADCARLLLAWSAVQRSRGRRDDSLAACVFACRVAEAAGDPMARAMFYLHGARLLSDLDEPGQSLRFAQAACGVIQYRQKTGLLAEVIVQKSIALALLQQHRESRVEAIAALRLAPKPDWRTRTSAWLQLANLAVARQDYRRALCCFGRARKIARAGRLKAIIEWRRAMILGRLGRVLEANEAFRAAIAVFERQKQPLDAARVAVDHLEMALRNGRAQDVLSRVRASSPCFEQLGCHSRAFELWMDLCALLLAGGSLARPFAQVAALRRALEELSSGPLGFAASR